MNENATYVSIVFLFFVFIGVAVYSYHQEKMKELEIRQMIVKDSLEHLRD